ncbi:MAG TPA: hypothetical protein VJQ49_03710 [Casimicrobiaceae bacterium]|nr:hypothetical protein [Casimicrobiaceae bacterium]
MSFNRIDPVRIGKNGCDGIAGGRRTGVTPSDRAIPKVVAPALHQARFRVVPSIAARRMTARRGSLAAYARGNNGDHAGASTFSVQNTQAVHGRQT